MVKFKEVASRLNGISTPIFGVSWTPPIADVTVARRVLVFLEDRRVLFSDYSYEVPEHCIESALEIRRFITEVLGAGGIADELVEPLRAIRAAARRFTDPLTRQSGGQLHIVTRGSFGPMMSDPQFNQALGELRAAVGLQVARIAVAFGVDVEPSLARILPPADMDG